MTVLGSNVPTLHCCDDVLHVRVVSRPPVALIELEGELDLATVHQLNEAMQRVAASDAEHVEVSLDRLQFFGACGVWALVSARELMIGRGKSFAVVSITRIGRLVLDLTDTTEMFGIDQSVAMDRV